MLSGMILSVKRNFLAYFMSSRPKAMIKSWCIQSKGPSLKLQVGNKMDFFAKCA